jgi:putative endonuclease
MVRSTPASRPIRHDARLSTAKDWLRAFSAKYGCKILVWYELHETMIDAITREKQIKAGSRAKKLALIEALNPDWKDLYETLI